MHNDIVINVGNIAKARRNFDDPQEGRVYCTKGVAPTIRSGEAVRKPQIVIPESYNLKV
jgi:hypothetical protein